MILDYARGRYDGRRLSRMAVLALPVGVLSFPLLLHWMLPGELYRLSQMCAISHDSVLRTIAYAWPATGVLFCAIACLRVALSKGRRCGIGFAAVGLVLACIWLVAAILFDLFDKPAPASW